MNRWWCEEHLSLITEIARACNLKSRNIQDVFLTLVITNNVSEIIDDNFVESFVYFVNASAVSHPFTSYSYETMSTKCIFLIYIFFYKYTLLLSSEQCHQIWWYKMLFTCAVIVVVKGTSRRRYL